jgi:hypothetical protein
MPAPGKHGGISVETRLLRPILSDYLPGAISVAFYPLRQYTGIDIHAGSKLFFQSGQAFIGQAVLP